MPRTQTDLRTGVDLDLRALRVWAPEPPADWEAVAAVCRRLHDRRDDLTRRMVEAIVAEVPEYGALQAVPRADLAASVMSNVDMVLLGIAEHRGPLAHELEVRRQLGRRRAQQGLPIDTLIAAFHIGYRELWSELVSMTKSGEGAAQAALLEGSATVWGWIQSVTSAVADEYRIELIDQDAGSQRRRSRFLDALISDPRSAECIAEAKEFGFDTDGTFRCFASAAPLSIRTERRLDDALERAGANWVRGTRAGLVLTLAQGPLPPAVTGAFGRDDVVGVGLARAALVGARQTLLDAELALAQAQATPGDSVCFFEASWLEALVRANAHQLTPFVDRCRPIAQRKPHLTEAVEEFAAANMSLAETARAMHLAPNSVRHRLQQWHKLTGYDPWTTSGLIRSCLLIELIPSNSNPSTAGQPRDTS